VHQVLLKMQQYDQLPLLQPERFTMQDLRNARRKGIIRGRNTSSSTTAAANPGTALVAPVDELFDAEGALADPYLLTGGDGDTTAASPKRHRYVTKEDMRRMITACRTLHERLWIMLMGWCGLRRRAVATLTIHDVFGDTITTTTEVNRRRTVRKVCMCTEKGPRRHHFVPTTELAEALILYMETERPDMRNGYVFPHRTRPGQHVCPMSISTLVWRLSRRLGLPGVQPSGDIFVGGGGYVESIDISISIYSPVLTKNVPIGRMRTCSAKDSLQSCYRRAVQPSALPNWSVTPPPFSPRPRTTLWTTNP
jgi:integrase